MLRFVIVALICVICFWGIVQLVLRPGEVENVRQNLSTPGVSEQTFPEPPLPAELLEGVNLPEVFQILADGQGTNFVGPTSTYQEREDGTLIIGFSAIPLELSAKQEYLVAVALTWTGPADKLIKFQVDAVPEKVVQSGIDLNDMSLQDIGSIKLAEVLQTIGNNSTHIVFPHARLAPGKYFLRFGEGGKLFSGHDIVINN